MLTEVAQVSQKIGMKTECHRRQNANFWEKEARSFAWRWKDRNWSKRRTLCIWEEISAHRRGGSDKDVERRIGLARGTWQALGKVWNSKELSKATKTRMYEVLVLSSLL